MKIAIALVGGLLAAVAVAGWISLRRGYSARDQPSGIEEFVARRLRHLATPAQAGRARNPVAPTPEALADARHHFADHCANCHANDGSGNTQLGKSFYPKAPDMRQAQTQSLSDGELFYIIRNGIRFTGMPAWGSGEAGKDDESWKLVHFIRRLPKLTPEELSEMESMNPRSPQEIEKEIEMRRFLEGTSAMEELKPAAGGHRH